MKTTTERTAAQNERDVSRNSAGKFVKNPCDFCGKGAPMTNYCSDDRVNTTGNGWGLVLHASCATKLGKLTDEEYGAMALFVQDLRAW